MLRSMKKTTIYWILGGVAATAAVGTVVYFVARKPALPQGGGGGQLPQGGGGGTPPPAPNPQNYGAPQNQQNQQNLLNDVAQWVNAMKGLQLSSELINSLYKSVQVIAANLGFLLPANPLPVW